MNPVTQLEKMGLAPCERKVDRWTTTIGCRRKNGRKNCPCDDCQSEKAAIRELQLLNACLRVKPAA